MALTALPVAAAGQTATFRSGAELVTLNVSVVRPDASFVDGLTRDQFQVFDDGQPQELAFFAAGELPLDVVILLDTSASMREALPLVQGAAARFASALRPIDRAAVMGISSGLRVLQTFTGDRAAVDRAIRTTTAGGKTPLYAALYVAMKELDGLARGATDVRRQAIVVLSDGQDTASGFQFADLLDITRRRAVPIYVIAPRPPRAVRVARERLWGESVARADYELKTLATETGGRAFFPVSLHELGGVYEGIANELAHQYSLAYLPPAVATDGAFRRIAVKLLKAPPGLKWRTRAGYIASSPVVGTVASASGIR